MKKGVMSRISHILMLVAMFMLMGMRVVPHHHSECTTIATGPLPALHFCFGECVECERHDCSEEHNNSGELCYDASLLYYRAADQDAISIKKQSSSLLFAVFLLPVRMTDVLYEKHEWYDIHVFRHSVPVYSLQVLRGPPVA